MIFLFGFSPVIQDWIHAVVLPSCACKALWKIVSGNYLGKHMTIQDFFYASLRRFASICAVLGLVMVFLELSYVHAQDNRDFILQGVLHRIEKLQSAEFRATGTKTVEGLDTDSHPQGEIKIHGAFDGENFRFDYGEPAMVVGVTALTDRIRSGEQISPEEAERIAFEATKASNLPQDAVATFVETYFIKTPEKVAYWFNGNPTVFVTAPNAEIPSSIRRFDINALGLYGILEFNQGLSAKTLVESYLSSPNCRVIEIGNGLRRLEFQFTNQITTGTWAIDVDTTHGFTTIGTKLTEYNRQLQVESVPQFSRVTWKNISEVWIPESALIATGTDESKTILSLEFEFNKINEPIDPSVFSHESFPAPAYAAVVDDSGGKPLIVREPFQKSQEITTDSTSSSRWLIFGSIGVFASLVYIVYRVLRLTSRKSL